MLFERFFAPSKKPEDAASEPLPVSPEMPAPHAEHAEPVPEVAETEDRRERTVEATEEFDPVALLGDGRIHIDSLQRTSLIDLLTNYGANMPNIREKAKLKAVDFDKVAPGTLRGEHEALSALKERRGEEPHYAPLRLLLFLVGEYLAGRDASPLKTDGTRTVAFNIRDGVGLSIRIEDWGDPHDRSQAQVVIEAWGKEHGPLDFSGETRFITAEK